MTQEITAILGLVFTGINTGVSLAAYLKTRKVERHTNGMQAQLIENARDKGEEKGRRDQKADDGNV